VSNEHVLEHNRKGFCGGFHIKVIWMSLVWNLEFLSLLDFLVDIIGIGL